MFFGPGDDTLTFTMAEPSLLNRIEAAGGRITRRCLLALSIDYGYVPVFLVSDSDGVFGVQIDTQVLALKMQDGSTAHMRLRESDCLHRMDGGWYSFFNMMSYPVDAKTGKSVMN